MSSFSRFTKRPGSAERYVFPIGSLWKKSDLDDNKSVKNYRQERTRWAKTKIALDVAAGVWLLLAVIALLVNAVTTSTGPVDGIATPEAVNQAASGTPALGTPLSGAPLSGAPVTPTPTVGASTGPVDGVTTPAGLTQLSSATPTPSGITQHLPATPPSVKTVVWSSPTSLLTTFAYIFTLQPLLSPLRVDTAMQTLCASVDVRVDRVLSAELGIFVSLVVMVLFHESTWLKRKILFSAATSPSSYEGFLKPSKKSTTDYWTRASKIVNHIFVICLLLTAASFLWSARQLTATRDPLAQPRILMAGIFLTIIGAFTVIKELEKRGAPKNGWWELFIDHKTVAIITRGFAAIFAALICATAFGVIVRLGLNRSVQHAKVVFMFGFVFMLTTWIGRHVFVQPGQKDQRWNISRRQLKTRSERFLHYWVQVPLTALGWAVNPFLIAIEFIVVRIQRRLARIVGWFAYRAKPILPYSVYMGLSSFGDSESIDRENDRLARELPTVQIVQQTERGFVGYDHTPRPLAQAQTFDNYVRKKYLHEIVEGDSWLTRWVKREPARQLRSVFGRGWDREDPLDFKRNVRQMGTNWPTVAESRELYRHLIALMLAVSFVGYVVKFALGHMVAAYGRPVFDKSLIYAAVFGLGAGILAALVTMLGKSSLNGLALGLVSGLALKPSLGAAEGLTVRLANESMAFFIGFAVTLLTSMGGGSSFIAGVLILMFGVYLQVIGR